MGLYQEDMSGDGRRTTNWTSLPKPKKTLTDKEEKEHNWWKANNSCKTRYSEMILVMKKGGKILN